MLNVIGWERMSGTSKKSGKPYDIVSVYAIVQSPFVHGNKCTDFVVQTADWTNVTPLPLDDSFIGRFIEVFYNKRGFVSRIEEVSQSAD